MSSPASKLVEVATGLHSEVGGGDDEHLPLEPPVELDDARSGAGSDDGSAISGAAILKIDPTAQSGAGEGSGIVPWDDDTPAEGGGGDGSGGEGSGDGAGEGVGGGCDGGDNGDNGDNGKGGDDGVVEVEGPSGRVRVSEAAWEGLLDAAVQAQELEAANGRLEAQAEAMREAYALLAQE